MIDLDAIEKAAEAAIPVNGLNWSFAMTTFGDYFYATKKESNYIATISPTVALAMVRELRALRELAFIVDSCMTFHQIKYPASEGIGNALAKVKAARVEK